MKFTREKLAKVDYFVKFAIFWSFALGKGILLGYLIWGM